MAMSRRQFRQERPPTAKTMAGLVERASIAVEPVSGWWTSNGKWGNRFQGQLPQAPDLIVPVLNLDEAPGPPRGIGIQLARSDRFIDFDGTQNSDVYARITYGAGGFTNVFDVDYASGTKFQVVANSVRVDAITYTPNPSNVYVPLDNIVLGATIGINAGTGCICPTLTIPTGRIDGGDEVNIAVPDFAKRVSFLFELDEADTQPSLKFFDIFSGSAGAVAVWGATIDEVITTQTNPLVLPGDANRIRIRNATAAPPEVMQVRVIFHLDL